MANYIRKEKGNHLPFWDDVKIIDREELWRISCLKEAAYMLGDSELLSKPHIEMNIQESILKKTKKNLLKIIS